MSNISVTTDWDEIAAKIGEEMSSRVRRKAVNAAGSAARRDLPALIAEAYSTSKAGVGARGKAATPGSTDPVYRLNLNRQIRLGRLKSGARKFQKKRNQRLGYLRVVQPQRSGSKGVDVFRAERGDAKAEYILPAGKGRKARRVGGPRLRRALDTNP